VLKSLKHIIDLETLREKGLHFQKKRKPLYKAGRESRQKDLRGPSFKHSRGVNKQVKGRSNENRRKHFPPLQVQEEKCNF